MVRLAKSMNSRLGLYGVVAFALVAGSAVAAGATMASPPGFSKAFFPETIGPGSTSVLTFTIDNSESVYPIDLLAFDDEFPFGMSLAAVPFVSNTCGGTVEFDEDDADSEFDVRLTGGKVGADKTCKVVVNVVGTTDCGGLAPEPNSVAISCVNTSGALTSDAGSSGTAMATLFVSLDEPGFSKSFSPDTVAVGGRSTLTFLIDNSANPSHKTALNFTDTLPAGMVIASPAFASTTCGTPPTVTPTLTANPGSNTISFSVTFGTASFPAIAAGATCTVTVDVAATTVGTLGNVSSNLLTDTEDFVGKATAALEVTGFTTPLSMGKTFVDDPVPPGFSTTLEFTVTNRSRTDSATGISFSDDLFATLAGLTPVMPLPSDPCGAGSMLSFAGGVLTLTGGSLAPEASCTFGVVLDVPLGSAPGSYTNTAGPVMGDVGGMPETGNSASDLLFVVDTPVLLKEFTDDPVGAGGTVMLEFTIVNTNDSEGLVDIEFTDDLDTAIACDEGSCDPHGLEATSLVGSPAMDVCGMGSKLEVFDPPDIMIGMIIIVTPPEPWKLVFSGGSLAAAGTPGDTCSFSVPLDVRGDVPGGTYTNTTSDVTGEYDPSTDPTTGPPAVGDVIIVGGPRLTKEYTDDPAIPGGTVTLEFTIENIDGSDAATAIAFSDDLGASLPGLTVTSVDTDTCGGTPSGVGTGVFGYTGGTVPLASSCSIVLTLTLPGTPPGGVFPNETSEITAMVGGVATSDSPAADDLLVSGFNISKEFLDDPVIAGGTVDLEFTLDNTEGGEDVTDIDFVDPVDPEVLPGLTVVSPVLPTTVCGGTLSTTVLPGENDEALMFTGGSVLAGLDCTFTVTLEVPAGTPDGNYLNATIDNSATIDMASVDLAPAVDDLDVVSNLLDLTKDFTDDPVAPGDPVTLAFTLQNLSSTETVTGIEFDDDLEATLSGLEAVAASFNDCGGMAAGFPAGLFEYSGGMLGPGATCSIVLTLDVPAGPLPGRVFPNTTTPVTGKVGTLDVFGAPATDDLVVQTVAFTKEFDGSTTAGGTAILTFTIENGDSVNPLLDLAFSDDLEAVISGLEATMLPADGFCGAGSTVSGPTFLAFTGLSLPASGMCTFDVTVTVPALATGGSFFNTTSTLTDSGLPVAEPATAFLEVEPPPLFSKSFAPDTIVTFDTSVLTFLIDNTAPAFAATSLDFTDVLPAGLEVAASPSPATTCMGGTLTAVPGSDTISYTGGSVAAGATCEVTVGVTGGSDGSFMNVSGDLTSSLGNSGSATATLTLTPALDADLAVTKVALIDPVLTGNIEIYRITISNLGASPAGGVTVEDALPTGTTFLGANPPAPDCVEAMGVLTCDLGSIAGGASVDVLVAVRLDTTNEGPLENAVSVSAANTDPDPGNNVVMTLTSVLPRTLLLGYGDSNLDGNSEYLTVVRNPRVRLRDGDDGTALSVYGATPASFRTVAARLTSLFGSSPLGDLAVLAYRESDTKTRVEVSDPVAGVRGLAVVAHGGPWMPIGFDLAAGYAGSTSPKAVILQERISDRRGRLLVKDMGGPSTTTLFYPAAELVMAVHVLPDSNANLAQEVGVLLLDPTDGSVRWQVNDLATMALLSSTVLTTGAVPMSTKLVPEIDPGGGGVLGMSTLLFRFDPERGETSTQNAVTGGGQLVKVVGNNQIPLELGVLPNFGGSLANDLASFLELSNGRGVAPIRDAATGALLGRPVLPIVYAPLGMVIIPNYGGTTADEVGLWGERMAPVLQRMFVEDAATNANPAARSALPVP